MAENILRRAEKIVYEKAEGKHEYYGEFSKNMEHTAKIATLLIGKEITEHDMYLINEINNILHNYF